MPAETMAPNTPTTFEPETVLRQQRLHRALAQPEALEEFLINPEDVAKRYGVPLNEAEVRAVRSASHFVAGWDLFCGDGKWLEAGINGGRRVPFPNTPTVGEIVAHTVRERIARDILQEIPEAIRRITDRVGGDHIVDASEPFDDFPPELQPLVKTLRGFARTLVRELRHEFVAHGSNGTSVRPMPPMTAAIQSTPNTGAGAPDPGPVYQSDPVYFNELVNRAVRQAVERIRPGVTRPNTEPARHFRSVIPVPPTGT